MANRPANPRVSTDIVVVHPEIGLPISQTVIVYANSASAATNIQAVRPKLNLYPKLVYKVRLSIASSKRSVFFPATVPSNSKTDIFNPQDAYAAFR